MKAKHLEKLGFELANKTTNDGYTMRRYRKGVILADITYEGDKFISWDISTDFIYKKSVTFPQLKQLDKILNQL